MQIVFDFFYQISGVTHLVFPPIMVEDHLNENMVLVLSSQPNTNRKQQIVINAKSKIKTLMFNKKYDDDDDKIIMLGDGNPKLYKEESPL